MDSITSRKKVYFESYGCSANQADAEMMQGLLKEACYELTDDKHEADLIVLNTCTVKEVTFHRMLYRLQEAVASGKPLVITGCMPKTERNAIERITPHATLLGPNAIHKIVRAVEESLEGKKGVYLHETVVPKLGLPRVRKNAVIAICSIATGCLGQCSYCQVKLAKGNLMSYPPKLILTEIKTSLKEGCKEIWLTAQDTGCYGRDIGTDLPELLEEIVKIPGDFFVRIGMMNPQHALSILDELVQVYKSPKIFKFLHIPVQSGADPVLTQMNRNYQVSEFRALIHHFKQKVPQLTVSTDIIVGFPGETQVDFQQTRQLIEDIKPDIVNISRYGKRPGTQAATLMPVPQQIVRERTRELTALCKKIRHQNNEKWKGWQGRVLLDEPGNRGGVISRNFAYKPIITNGPLGSFKIVRVSQTRPNVLIAES